MMMYKIDYHGWKTEAALQDLESVIGSIRKLRQTQQAEFITGHGIIQDEVLKLLKSYSLEPSIQLGNAGVVVVTIE